MKSSWKSMGAFWLAASCAGAAPWQGLPSQTPATMPSLRDFSGSLEALSAKVRRGVVQIFATGYGTVEDSDTGANTSLISRQKSTGSGIVAAADGYIVTNAHVVQGARRIQVKLAADRDSARDGPVMEEQRLAAKLVGIDQESDLAVIKIQRAGLTALEFGDSDDVRQGQLVLAFGNPFGLEGSVTMGVVSSISRQIRPDDPLTYIQTDAPINPGNSGGPLVDAAGRVVGMNTLIFSQSGGSEGVGFAIPSNAVQAIYKQLRENGHVHRGQIGIYAQTVTAALASGLGLTQNWGVVVADVAPEGPAAAAGIEIGDIVLSLNGRAMGDARQLEVEIYRHALNERVRVELLRGERRIVTVVRVIEREDDPLRFADMVNPEENLVPKLGILGIGLDANMSDLLPDLRMSHGVVVAALSADSNPDGTGLEAGDVIYSVNGKKVKSVSALKDSLKPFSSGDTAVLQIERDGRLMFLTVEIE